MYTLDDSVLPLCLCPQITRRVLLGFQINFSRQVNLQIRNLQIVGINGVPVFACTAMSLCLSACLCVSVHLSVLKTMNSHQYLKFQCKTVGSLVVFLCSEPLWPSPPASPLCWHLPYSFPHNDFKADFFWMEKLGARRGMDVIIPYYPIYILYANLRQADIKIFMKPPFHLVSRNNASNISFGEKQFES